MKDIVKTAIVLSIIAIIAGALLGFVNSVTYLTPEEKLQRNLAKAYDGAKGYEIVDVAAYDKLADSQASMKAIYKMKAEKPTYIYHTNSTGYAKGLELMVVVEDNKVVNIVKVASGETIAKPLSEVNFIKYKNIDLTTIDGFYTSKQAAVEGKEKIDAISGATKSSNAICNALDLVVAYHNQIEGGAAK